MTATSVSTPDALECVRDALVEHHRHVAGVANSTKSTPLLLAVALAERERLQAMVDAILKTENGLLVDATVLSDSIHLTGTLADVADLRDAVDALIVKANGLPDDPQLKLTIDADDVRIDGATPFASTSTSQQALRSLLLSLFHENLRVNALTAIVYAEDALDDDHTDLVWSLLMRLHTLLNRPPSSTLIVVAGDSRLSPDRHCVGTPSLRWRVTENGLVVRHTREHDEGITRRLAAHSRKDCPLNVMMLGAGTSARYLPTGNEVRDVALGNATSIKVDSGTFRDAARTFFTRLQSERRLIAGEETAGPELFADRLTLERVLREEQHEERTPFSTTLRWFADKHQTAIDSIEAARATGSLATDPVSILLQRRERLVLLTVNFDRVIETKGGSDVRAFVTDDDLTELPDYLADYAENGGPVPLIKIHGDIEQHDTIIANVESTLVGLSEPMNTALQVVKDRLLAQTIKPLTYVGYSMRDVDLADFWAADKAFATSVIENWVAPFPDPAVLAFIAEKRKARWGGELDPHTVDGSFITLTADDFFEVFTVQAQSSW